MNRRSKIAAAACAALMLAAFAAAAQDKPPVPKMFQGMGKEKGQYRVDFLEGGPGAAGKGGPRTMTICTDNLASQSANRSGPRPESSCKYRLLKDTASEAVIETACKERTTTVAMKRESDKSVLMDMTSTGAGGPHHMKMRYTHLGACREGQGAVSFDKDSEQCKKIRAQAAKMDPEKSCAREKANREQCLQRMRETVSKLTAMCN